ncbi:unnamed protein product [Clonostachys chloroleuca]|uniref:Telomerase reverse transcriptase n=1 Tax=Clonostachys chloroleuca TaxID=1926264 RepID=A0AA35MEC5_9HYPO|nr:unnamed protein product [Clonostachys chloroleuca]
MTRRAKRKRDSQKPDADQDVPQTNSLLVTQKLLEHCFPNVQTLRQHLLSQLPSASRLRRKKITALTARDASSELEGRVAALLDTALVCSRLPQAQKSEASDIRWEQWKSFSQKGDESYVSISDTRSAKQSQNEILEFVVWLLFNREKTTNTQPCHVLCNGFDVKPGNGDKGTTSIPGVYFRFPSSSFEALKEAPWPQVLALLGQSGERLMIDLLLDYSLFVAVDAGHGNFYQLSGVPLFMSSLPVDGQAATIADAKPFCRKPGEITLMRNKTLYAKPSLTAAGTVQAGFRHIHILNRCPYVKPKGDEPSPEEREQNEANTTKVMMYMFPRQFGLHNAFTSEVDKTRTTMKFQDYTYREDEISEAFVSRSNSPEKTKPTKLPKRLKGIARDLIMNLQVRHSRCAYFELLRYYCPSAWDTHRPAQNFATQASSKAPKQQGDGPNIDGVAIQGPSRPKRVGQKTHSQSCHSDMPSYNTLVELACPIGNVSAYCQAVLAKIVPDRFWGEGDTMVHNKRMFRSKVDHFIRLRRFEVMSLHEVVQDLKANIPWLRPPDLAGQKTSQTDISKRYELFHEFLYYVFDSLLIPLVRNNFYVTESNIHRNRLFYFRHDIWRRITEPAMATLKENMLEPLKLVDATRILDSRRLGFSQLRLLPKTLDLRPIMNLGKKMPGRGRSKTFGASINWELKPIHHMLNAEKAMNASKLGSSMLSTGEIYSRLKEFKLALGSAASSQRFYFAKIDVHAAFDTIPQEAVIKLMNSVPSRGHYTVVKHVEMMPDPRTDSAHSKGTSKSLRTWHFSALKKGEPFSLPERLERDISEKKINTVFIEGNPARTYHTAGLLKLLEEHVSQNIVKVGKRFYRQKRGIPQGSVVSSFLCNYFYADLEARHLHFLNGPDSILLRFMDDFLFITQDKKKAVQFVETMHQGVPEYGVEVNTKKTLLNFHMKSQDEPLSTISHGEKFPYCGTLIDCQTLEISRNHNKDPDNGIANSLTVEFGRLPGQNFEKKMLHAFRIQSKPMYYDTSHNSTATVLDSLYGAFYETAQKMSAYIHCLPKSKRPSKPLILRSIIKMVDVAFSLLTGKSRRMRLEGYSCDLRKGQVFRTGYRAFIEVLSKRQTAYGEVISWLKKEVERINSTGRSSGSSAKLEKSLCT